MVRAFLALVAILLIVSAIVACTDDGVTVGDWTIKARQNNQIGRPQQQLTPPVTLQPRSKTFWERRP